MVPTTIANAAAIKINFIIIVHGYGGNIIFGETITWDFSGLYLIAIIYSPKAALKKGYRIYRGDFFGLRQ
jgi:hypothetical protein